MITEKQSKAIKKILIDKDLTNDDLVNIMGISRQYLNSLMSGKVNNKKKEKELLDWYLKNL